MKQSFTAIGLVFPLLVAAATAQTLQVAGDAPQLKIAKWVKGEPIDAFKPGQVYVVEFWATWCGPCIASMPHLTDLQAAYKDKGLTVIGVTSADPRNTLAKVEQMVADKADGIGYAVAWDDGSKTSDAFMKAAKQTGIPCSFLVDGKGKVAYIGHPSDLAFIVGDVIAGTWDATKAKQTVDAAKKKMADAVDGVIKDADKGRGAMEAAHGKNDLLAKMADQLLFDKLMAQGAYDRAFPVAAKLIDQAIAAKDAMALNEVSWAIVDPATKIAKRDLDLAMKGAVKAVEYSKEKDANILDTLARVWFWKGDIQKAYDLQKKAVAIDSRDDIKKTMDEYQALIDKAKADKAPAPATEGKKGDK